MVDLPVAFLCHGSKDKELVLRLAKDLRGSGIEVFYDDWDIRAGDSLREKIDEGLRRCTHFIAVLSPTSIKKPWVNAEMDAGFVQRLAGKVKFIALRFGLPPESLPPLLSGSHSPSIDSYESDVAALISDIHGMTRKPPLGAAPTAKAIATGTCGLSPAAEAMVRLMVTQSKSGATNDPMLGLEEIRKSTGLNDTDLVDAVDELEEQGYVGTHRHMGCGAIGFDRVFPKGELFVAFDGAFGIGSPEADAVTLATKLMDRGRWLPSEEGAKELGWSARRMNPALHFLMMRNLVQCRRSMRGGPWVASAIGVTDATRRFARGRDA